MRKKASACVRRCFSLYPADRYFFFRFTVCQWLFRMADGQRAVWAAARIFRNSSSVICSRVKLRTERRMCNTFSSSISVRSVRVCCYNLHSSAACQCPKRRPRSNLSVSWRLYSMRLDSGFMGLLCCYRPFSGEFYFCSLGGSLHFELVSNPYKLPLRTTLPRHKWPANAR